MLWHIYIYMSIYVIYMFIYIYIFFNTCVYIYIQTHIYVWINQWMKMNETWLWILSVIWTELSFFSSLRLCILTPKKKDNSAYLSRLLWWLSGIICKVSQHSAKNMAIVSFLLKLQEEEGLDSVINFDFQQLCCVSRRWLAFFDFFLKPFNVSSLKKQSESCSE